MDGSCENFGGDAVGSACSPSPICVSTVLTEGGRRTRRPSYAEEERAILVTVHPRNIPNYASKTPEPHWFKNGSGGERVVWK